MNVSAVRDRVTTIRGFATDPERAHETEDVLYIDVLRAIANGHTQPAILARAALEAESIDFPRWCA